MREAVIVSTARTPIGRAYRGAFNNTNGPTLGGMTVDRQCSSGMMAIAAAAKTIMAGEMDILGVMDKETREISFHDVVLEKDEGNRPTTTLEGLASLKTVRENGHITAGNASQLSDGASASDVMEARLAEKRGLEPLGYYRGTAVAGCEPDEMGIGPVFAIPKLLQQAGLAMDDIGLWELNEAFAVQVVYCRDRLGIPNENLNVHGGGQGAASLFEIAR